jgi:tetrapyrrole methylase family protein/MazG family protein
MDEFARLVELMATLRGEQGCSWDRKQTTKAFKTYLLEEVYELIDAIEKDDYKALEEELGDLLFHIVFISQICKDDGRFDIRDVVNSVYEKMYNRHPHVFKGASADKPIEIKWEEIKKNEKEYYHPLSDVPSIMPALLRAYIITKRAARIGFDWERVDDVYVKMSEEIEELKKAEQLADIESITEEVGDLLFTMVNISRFYSVDPEDALRQTCDKFIRRFSYIESKTDIKTSTLSKMDSLWNEIKNIEKKGS